MTFFGELLGYDSRGNDLLGYPSDPQYACVACGVACNVHTPHMEAECLRKIFGRHETEEKRD